MKIVKCRRCPAKIVWLYTKNQKAIPVNAETVKDGDVEFDPKVHTTHFATCPFATSFRAKKDEATKTE